MLAIDKKMMNLGLTFGVGLIVFTNSSCAASDTNVISAPQTGLGDNQPAPEAVVKTQEPAVVPYTIAQEEPEVPSTVVPDWVTNNPCAEYVGTQQNCVLNRDEVQSNDTLYNYPGGIKIEDYAGVGDVTAVAGGQITLDGVGEGWDVFSAQSAILLTGNTSGGNTFTSCGVNQSPVPQGNDFQGEYGFLSTRQVASSTVNSASNISVANASVSGSIPSTFTSGDRVEIGRGPSSDSSAALIDIKPSQQDAVQEACAAKTSEYLGHIDELQSELPAETAPISPLASGLSSESAQQAELNLDLVMFLAEGKHGNS